MESEVKLNNPVCLFLRGRKLLTALVLYSFVASIIIMLILHSTKTIKILQTGGRFSINLLNLTQNRFLNRSTLSQTETDVYEETEFIFSKNSGTKDHAQPKKRMQYSSGSTVGCGSDPKNLTNGCRGRKDDGLDISEHQEAGSNRFHSIRHHYKSMTDLQPLDFHCDSCAIVSSSGQLLARRAGPEIDSHSCVLRMNVAPTRGFERDVGFKTTVRIICFMSTAALKTRARELLLGNQQAELYLFWGLNAPKHRQALGRVQMLAKEYEAEFYSLDDEGEAEAGRLFENETGKNREKTNSWLSTGWFTMMLAIDMCDEIHVYGMVPEDYCSKYGHKHVKYHYWQNSWSPGECDHYKANEYSKKGGHRFFTEKAIFQRWALKYNITFHNPGWNLEQRRNYEERPINTPFMRRTSGKAH